MGVLHAAESNTCQQLEAYFRPGLYYIFPWGESDIVISAILARVCNTFAAQLFGDIRFSLYLCGVINKH
jgi:hypothetical protein